MNKSNPGKREESQEYETIDDEIKLELHVRKKVEENCIGKDFVSFMEKEQIQKKTEV